jgi:hypothetical protein
MGLNGANRKIFNGKLFTGEMAELERRPLTGRRSVGGSYKVDRRFGEGRGKPLDEGSAGPIVVETFRGGVCLTVDVSRLR